MFTSGLLSIPGLMFTSGLLFLPRLLQVVTSPCLLPTWQQSGQGCEEALNSLSTEVPRATEPASAAGASQRSITMLQAAPQITCFGVSHIPEGIWEKEVGWTVRKTQEQGPVAGEWGPCVITVPDAAL